MILSLKRHSRFVMAVAAGGAGLLLAWGLAIGGAMQILFGVNGFFVAYLGLSLRLAQSTTPDDLKRYAEVDDEGIIVIVLLAIGAVIVSLGASLWVLNRQEMALWQAAWALWAVPLGWSTIHTLVGFRYAHLFYSDKSRAGLTFPGTSHPGLWDFFYLSFGIGMTAQVSDVIIQDTRIRKLVLGHSIGAFFYNTVILALAVNAGLALGG
jgi:uncharacterized membrane protein